MCELVKGVKKFCALWKTGMKKESHKIPTHEDVFLWLYENKKMNHECSDIAYYFNKFTRAFKNMWNHKYISSFIYELIV